MNHSRTDLDLDQVFLIDLFNKKTLDINIVCAEPGCIALLKE